MTVEDAPGISVHDKYRMIPRIEKNRVCRLGPDAIQPEQFLAQLSGWLGEHLFQGTAILPIEKLDERLQPLRLLPEVARRPDQTLAISPALFS